MNKLNYTLQIIYKNRYRKLIHKDASFFWVILVVYFFILIKLVNRTSNIFPMFDFTPYLLGCFMFTTCQYINDRTDWEILCNPFNKRKVYFIYLLDLLISNSITIAVSIYLREYNVIYFSGFVILFFTFYSRQKGKIRFKFPFQKIDVLMITNYRRYKINSIIILLATYLAYQGLTENNKNLFTISFFSIIYINYGLIMKTEKLEYFLFSKLSNKQYILKNELSFIIDCLLTTIPCILLTLFIQPSFMLELSICFLFIPLIFPIKYIFINYSLPLAFSSGGIIILFLTGVMNDEIDWSIIISIFPVSIFLHIISFRKFTKQIIRNNTEFYL
mgnify:CR=1 FL=1